MRSVAFLMTALLAVQHGQLHAQGANAAEPLVGVPRRTACARGPILYSLDFFRGSPSSPISEADAELVVRQALLDAGYEARALRNETVPDSLGLVKVALDVWAAGGYSYKVEVSAPDSARVDGQLYRGLRGQGSRGSKSTTSSALILGIRFYGTIRYAVEPLRPCRGG
jgi:hypothetical protein